MLQILKNIILFLLNCTDDVNKIWKLSVLSWLETFRWLWLKLLQSVLEVKLDKVMELSPFDRSKL